SAKGISVFLFDEVPYPADFLPSNLARTVWWGGDARATGISVADYLDRNRFTGELSGHAKFARISPIKSLCPNGVFCPAAMDGRSNYVDATHLSTHGSEKIAPAFVDALSTIDWK